MLLDVLAQEAASVAESAAVGPDPLVVAIIGAILAIMGSLFISIIARNWTHADREVDHIKQSGARDVDRVWGASTRELDQIQDVLVRIQQTQIELQKAILRVELRIAVVEGFTETSKEITRSRGAVGSGR